MTKEKRNHCGLCNVLVEDWERHKKSKEHQANLANPGLLQQRTLEHQLDLERSMRGGGNDKSGTGS